MTVYRENILEIVDNWGGYPLQTAFGCEPDLSDLSPAINAGIIELKCFINNVCPFFESGYKEDTLVFNEDTYKRIQPWLPEDLDNVLTVTPGMPGIHFRPKKCFRHNYIYHKYEGDAVAQSDVSIDSIDDLWGDFDDKYREITAISQSATSSQPGVDQTRYKAEQSWVVMRSIFDPPCPPGTGAEECDAQADWRYIGQKVSDTELDDDDLSLDYQEAYYETFRDNWEPKVKGQSRKLRPGKKLLINKFRAQMPIQKRVLSSENKGVHWRLMKRTPLFKGEDFFIRFHKQASDSIVDTNATDTDSIEEFPDEFSQYFPLDITRNDRLNIDVGIGGEAMMRKRNFAISPPTVGNHKPKNKKYDFHDQAYYIIELGIGTFDERYFIIICERANPIFVNFVPAVGGEVSKKLGEFTKIIGKQLIDAKSFDMTVRNHLGSIVIQFSGEGINVPPWIIKRWDWKPDRDPVSGEMYLKDKVRLMFVPRARMAIMGGNLRAGFIFGPLQYQAENVTIIYPPREQLRKEEDGSEQAFTHDRPIKIRAGNAKGAFKTSPFFLPTAGAHDILFSSTDIFVEDLLTHTVPVGESAFNQPLFMQDAQFYKNYYESDDPTAIPGAAPGVGYRWGVYLYNEILKDFSTGVITGAGHKIRTSNIVVKKYRYLEDPKTRQTAFDVLIGMMTGDHVFTYGDWSTASPIALGDAVVETGKTNHKDIPFNMWFLKSCKTPIITSLRLISHESLTTRWADGTIAATGINPTPEEGTSPYFIDATDHVMSFSDSWSASGFSEMEHSGSINFYLNRGMPVENNVTDALMSLQNKTFYIEIWAGYTRPCPDSGYSSYSRQNGLFKLFTGLCHGGDIDYQYGKNIMSCKVEDYTTVLKGSRFFNSPWFDGVKDINCIREIMQMAGFRDIAKYDPGHLIKFLSNNASRGGSGVFFHHFDGRLFKMESYALPSGYNRLDQPAFKFNDGDPFMDAIAKIAKRAGKVFFFDQWGIAHYENFQDIIQNDYLGRTPIVPLCVFTTNPELWPGQLIFNKLERNYDVRGIINHIKIMSNTPDFYLLIGDDLNWSSMDNPESEGFIGYLKSMYQPEGSFGSKEAMMDTIRKYSVAFRPKIISKFETYGVPLRANDIVQVNGENTRVTKVTNNITAEKNEWWMEVETEKYQVIKASRTVG